MDKNTKVVTYDSVTLSDAEIVAPKINKTEPLLEIRALRQAYKTAETTDAIKKVVGDRTTIKLGEAKGLLHAAAAVISAERQMKASKTNDQIIKNNSYDADYINNLNSKFYGV